MLAVDQVCRLVPKCTQKFASLVSKVYPEIPQIVFVFVFACDNVSHGGIAFVSHDPPLSLRAPGVVPSGIFFLRRVVFSMA